MTPFGKASETAGWILTSLGVVASTAYEQRAVAIATAVSGISILGLNVVLKFRKAIRDEELAGLKHEIERLHLKAEEKAEQSREAWARVGAETVQLKTEIETLKAASNHSLSTANAPPANGSSSQSPPPIGKAAGDRPSGSSGGQ